MKYSILNFGCRVNRADALGFEEQLRSSGAVAGRSEQADLVLVNTCSVTATADQDARQAIRRVARANPNARIVVTGCYATRRPEDVRKLPNVVRVVANDDKPWLLTMVAGELGMTTANCFGTGDGSCGAPIEPGVAGRTAFTLRVQTGCAEPCAYCIIPATRGRPRSVAPVDALREVDRIVTAGFKEIAVTGVHLGAYGRDLAPASSLIELLQALAACTRARGRERAPASGAEDADVLFRIGSLEPMDCTREIVDLVAGSHRFAPHFHLPLQHASNRMLAAMRRPYTISQYAHLVELVRQRIPHASLGSDVVVGFPGETDDDAEQLARYLEESPLTYLHVFPYSARPGTTASRMASRPPGAVVRDRTARVRAIGHRLARRFRQSQIGTTRRGLTLEDGTLVVTDNYLKVRIPPGRARNEWVGVTLTGDGTPMDGRVNPRCRT